MEDGLESSTCSSPRGGLADPRLRALRLLAFPVTPAREHGVRSPRHGLPLGIDAASHEGALAAGGLTVAVFGTGLDRVYPAEHAPLAARIREHGAR
ncbi:MAG: hypothetical protein E6K42_10960 [Gammaproteobacteria bacterium]|nr:MAG: hypothetical protein E6K42_10960 [Gammaproteobacteria bacterium]